MEEPHTLDDELDLLFLFSRLCMNIVVRHIVKFSFIFPCINEGVCLFQKEIFNFVGFFAMWDFQLGGWYFYIYTLRTREREACDGTQMGLELGGAYVAFSIWEGLPMTSRPKDASCWG
jgi:hypothetical protein